MKKRLHYKIGAALLIWEKFNKMGGMKKGHQRVA
jgi:hypothetical protein